MGRGAGIYVQWLLNLGLFVTTLKIVRGAAGEMSTYACLHSDQFLCDNGKCIPNTWRCDKDFDCSQGSDKSDERDCRTRTCVDTEFTCDNGKCIPARWKCDQEHDCEDGSDEKQSLCSKNTCSANQFSCGVGLNCISRDWLCDEQEDCANGEDETNCATNVPTCRSDEFHCNITGKCISTRWLCDEDNDCGDNSDEIGCGKPTCSSEQFQCSDGTCITHRWKCDGDHDCIDASDELNCTLTPTTQCDSTEFQCGDDRCINRAWVCDGAEDCNDKSDELKCRDMCKPIGKFRCNNTHSCIYSRLRCDGNDDCGDKSDEAQCFGIIDYKPVVNKCDDFTTMFQCNEGNNKECYPFSKMCDGTMECINRADESTQFCPLKSVCTNNPCKVGQGVPANVSICVPIPRGNYCKCKPGYKLDTDRKTCIDINECEIPGKCSHLCKNHMGGHRCECFPGYKVDQKTQQCKAIHGHTCLLFANRHDIRLLNLTSNAYTDIVFETKSAVALDFDARRKMIFWSDHKQEKIYSAPFERDQRADNVSKPLVDGDIHVPDGIAYDWIYQNLYWTDTGKNTIEVVNVINKARKILISGSPLDEPRAIVVDPRFGFMYWTDWGKRPAIHKAGMDGSITHVNSVLISEKADLLWPNGLTIDYTTNHLYWVDAKLHLIGSYNIDTNQYRKVLMSIKDISHAFSITVFEDNLFYTDWNNEKIMSVNKFTGKNVTEIKSGLYNPNDLHVFHELRQPITVNHCDSSDGSALCSHLCLPTPQSKQYKHPNNLLVNCQCPQGLVLLSDHRTCNKTTGTVPFKNIKPTLAPRVGPKSVPASTMTTKTPANVPVIRSTEVPSGQQSGDSSSNETGRVAGITVGIVVAIIIVLALVAVIAYKHIKRRNIKSMHFDNPVYRKTTTADDQIRIEKSQYQPSSHLPPSLQPLTDTTNNDLV